MMVYFLFWLDYYNLHVSWAIHSIHYVSYRCYRCLQIYKCHLALLIYLHLHSWKLYEIVTTTVLIIIVIMYSWMINRRELSTNHLLYTAVIFLYSFSTSTGGQSLLSGKEIWSPGQREDACGGRAGVHDQEVSRCLRAAGQHQPGAAEEREVRRGGCIDFTICLPATGHMQTWCTKIHHFVNLIMDRYWEPTNIDFITRSVTLNNIVWITLFNFVIFHLGTTIG